jgi:hypothetical protein
MDITASLRILAGITWIVLITVMFGGFSLLQLLMAGNRLTPFQIRHFRVGHAHGGVLTLATLLYVLFLAWTDYSTGFRIAAWIIFLAGALAQSGGFFLHMLVGKPDQRSAGTILTMTGAVALAIGTLILAHGLFSA